MKYFYILILFFLLSCNNRHIENSNKIKFCDQNIDINEVAISCIGKKNLDLKALLKFKKLKLIDLTKSSANSYKIFTKIHSLKYILFLNNKNNIVERIPKLKKEIKIFYYNQFLKNECNYLNEIKDFRINIYVSKHLNTKELNLFNPPKSILCNSSYIEVKYLMFLKYLNNLENLKIHLKSEQQFYVIENLKSLKKLYLSGNIKKIKKIPPNLEKLYLYNTKIKNFYFLNNSNLKYLEIITNNSKNEDWKRLKENNYNIDIKILDKIFFSPTRYDFINNLIIDDSEIKVTERKLNILYKKRRNFYNLNSIINNPKFSGPFLEVNNEQYKLIKDLRELIRDNDWLYLTLINNYILINYLLKYYELKLNHLNDKNKTLLDNVINEVDKNIIKLLRKHGAKRGCEILKTKCEPLSPEIEKILKNNDKTKGDK